MEAFVSLLVRLILQIRLSLQYTAFIVKHSIWVKICFLLFQRSRSRFMESQRYTFTPLTDRTQTLWQKAPQNWILNSKFYFALRYGRYSWGGNKRFILQQWLKLWYLFKQKIWRNGIYKVFSICTLSIWEEICWPYKAPFWCHIFCIFEHLFWQLRGVLCQNFQHFLKIYECQIVYIPLFWPVLHRGPVQLPIHFTLPKKIVAFQNIICSLFSPVFVFLSHIIDRYDVQGYPVCLEGH